MRLWVMALTLLAGLLRAAPPPSEDIRFLQSAAEGGNAEAQYLLGLHYHEGFRVRRDEVEAARWFLKAAESGHAEAQSVLGGIYADNGDGLKDPAKAEKWLQAAAAQGNQAAQGRLGALLAKGGRGGPLDSKPVSTTPPSTEATGVAVSQATSTPGSEVKTSGLAEDPGETVRWSLILSALRGPDAFVVRGYLLENGIAMNRDLESAAASYRKAAEAGHALGQYHLALMYAKGHGMQRDAIEACAWLRLASAGGVPAAQEHLTALEARMTQEEKSAASRRARDFSALRPDKQARKAIFSEEKTEGKAPK